MTSRLIVSAIGTLMFSAGASAGLVEGKIDVESAAGGGAIADGPNRNTQCTTRDASAIISIYGNDHAAAERWFANGSAANGFVVRPLRAVDPGEHVEANGDAGASPIMNLVRSSVSEFSIKQLDRFSGHKGGAIDDRSVLAETIPASGPMALLGVAGLIGLTRRRH